MKILNYFKQGKGRGLRAVLIFNILIACLIWWASANMMKALFNAPVFQEFINSVPEITVKDHKVIDPLNLNTVRNIGNMPLLYIQTDRDNIGVGSIQDGVYITRQAITVFASGTIVSQTTLPEEAVINPAKIQAFFNKITLWMPLVFGLIYMGILWIFYLLLVGLTYLVAWAARLLKKFDATAIWRFAMLAHILIFAVDFGLGFIGRGFPVLIYHGYPVPLLTQMIAAFILTIALTCVIAFCGHSVAKKEPVLKQNKTITTKKVTNKKKKA